MIPILNKIFNSRPITARQKSAFIDAAKAERTGRIFNLELIQQAQCHIDNIQNQIAMTPAEKNEFWLSNYSPKVHAEIKGRREVKALLTKTKHGFITSKPQAPKAAAKPAPTAAAPVVNLLTALSDGELITAATHRSAPTAGKPAARAELLCRGITVSEDGQCITRSHNFKPIN